MLFRTLLERVMPRPGSARALLATRRPATCRPTLEALECRFAPATLTTVMSGLDNPRGLAFGPEGALYVAEAGRGGPGPSIVIRPGVVASYGPTGAVSRLWQGQQERVATGLPSLIAPDGATGPHDISFQGLGNAFVTVGWGGDPTRRPELGEVGAGFAQLVRLLPNGHWQAVTDIGANEAAANPGGGPLESNPYGVLAEAGGRVVTDAAGNALLRVAANGDITTLAEFPSRDDGRPTDAVPTSVALGPDGAYYVGELTGVPFTAGAANVYRVVPGQAPQVVHTGFKTIIDLDFGPDGSLYVLQHATSPVFFGGNGALIRVAPDGTRTTVASEGLVRPTSVLVGDDGAIYVSNRGISVGTGEVVSITLSPATVAGLGALGSFAPGAALVTVTSQWPRPASLAGSPLTISKLRPRSETADPAFVVDAVGNQTAAPAKSRLPQQSEPETSALDFVFRDAWRTEGDLFFRPTRRQR